MSLLELFRKRAKERPPQEDKDTNGTEELDIYSGMRVEVTTAAGQILFVAKLMGLHGDKAELHQYSEAAISEVEEPLPVRIRGYSDRERKAVYMEGAIMPLPQNKWSVSEFKVCRVGNDRAFFRLTTNLDATATMFSGQAGIGHVQPNRARCRKGRGKIRVRVPIFGIDRSRSGTNNTEYFCSPAPKKGTFLNIRENIKESRK